VKSTGFVLVTNASGLRRDLAAAGLAANLVFDRTIDAGHNNIYDHASLVAAMRLPHDRVLVKRVEAEEKTKGGIIIPDTAQEKPQEADVIAVGSGARDESGKLIPIDLKVGDRILLGKWSGTEIKIDGEDRLILKESDVMGVVEKHAAPGRQKA
jgi:chaperonin GroES